MPRRSFPAPLIASLLFGLPAAFVAAACGPHGPPATPTPPVASSASPEPTELLDAAWAKFSSKRFDLRMPFPDGKSWRIDDHGSPWLSASHPGSSSSARVRVWRESELASRDRCEKRARAWAPDLPIFDGARIVDDRTLPAVPAPGFDTRVVVGIAKPAGSDTIDGFVVAFGASNKKCFAYVMQTRARGAGAAERTGDRLGLGVRMLEGAFLQSELEPPREPHEVPGR